LGMLAVLIGLLSVGGGAILLTSSDLTIVALNAAAVVFGILFLVSGIGFFQGKRWAWSLGVLVAVLSVIRNVAEVVQGLIITAVPGIVLALVVIYYLMTPAVKGYFGRGTQVTGESADSKTASP
jgi:uncharacterized membrane protein (DUF2068 family)